MTLTWELSLTLISAVCSGSRIAVQIDVMLLTHAPYNEGWHPSNPACSHLHLSAGLLRFALAQTCHPFRDNLAEDPNHGRLRADLRRQLVELKCNLSIELTLISGKILNSYAPFARQFVEVSQCRLPNKLELAQESVMRVSEALAQHKHSRYLRADMLATTSSGCGLAVYIPGYMTPKYKPIPSLPRSGSMNQKNFFGMKPRLTSRSVLS